jgi:HD superfamily phosphodiesterase
MNTPVTIGGFSAPDSELARKASALVERVHSKALLHHVHRTWWFAEFLGQRRGFQYDRETVYLAALLHDLGLTPEFAADQRFEVDGADTASRFLRANGYPQAKAEQVWDAIALHSSALADVGRRHIHGFDCPNVCDLIDNAPFDS